ncbi:uncharacterized protein LOC128218544 isoform X2 [Mya arenaria]|uniref:uncharacterized protein LOC128218544 isoform X2 n=1 Tax=Mya arenaria TaxID=6604 RepID=UPI0022E0EF02|nr:uncharacterized protein LOC128218544 isoform X2 [Mya arenaria]
MEGSLIKKAKSIFEHSGEFDEDDEVTFTFPNEDNNQLFYSKFILSRCSPVFKAMFKHDFKEKKDKNVIIEDIKVADFKTFFKWCDPMLSEHLTAENVLQMVEIAEKYQIEAMIQQCRKIMHHDIVDKTFQQAKSDRYFATYHIDDIVKDRVLQKRDRVLQKRDRVLQKRDRVLREKRAHYVLGCEEFVHNEFDRNVTDCG